LDIAVRDDARDDESRVLVRIDDGRADARIPLPKGTANRLGGREVPDADAGREKERAN
jgi:hypothetical protein